MHFLICYSEGLQRGVEMRNIIQVIYLHRICYDYAIYGVIRVLLYGICDTRQ